MAEAIFGKEWHGCIVVYVERLDCEALGLAPFATLLCSPGAM